MRTGKPSSHPCVTSEGAVLGAPPQIFFNIQYRGASDIVHEYVFITLTCSVSHVFEPAASRQASREASLHRPRQGGVKKTSRAPCRRATKAIACQRTAQRPADASFQRSYDTWGGRMLCRRLNAPFGTGRRGLRIRRGFRTLSRPAVIWVWLRILPACPVPK